MDTSSTILLLALLCSVGVVHAYKTEAPDFSNEPLTTLPPITVQQQLYIFLLNFVSGNIPPGAPLPPLAAGLPGMTPNMTVPTSPQGVTPPSASGGLPIGAPAGSPNALPTGLPSAPPDASQALPSSNPLPAASFISESESGIAPEMMKSAADNVRPF